MIKTFKEHIDKGQYDNAMKLLQSSKDELDPEIFLYNMAVLKFKQGQWGESRFYLEKSKQEGFDGPYYQKLKEQLDSEVGFTQFESVSNTQDAISYNLYTANIDLVLSLSLFLMLMSVVVLKFTKSKFSSLIILFLAIVIGGATLWTQKSTKDVIIQEIIQVRRAPSEAFDPEFELQEGVRVIVGKQFNGWERIIFPKNLTGWVKNMKYKALRD